MFGLDTVSVVVGLCGSASGFLFWFATVVKKAYGRERDSSHLLRSYEQLSANLAVLVKDQDSRFDRIDLALSELKLKK
jgi:hypothetical protein